MIEGRIDIKLKLNLINDYDRNETNKEMAEVATVKYIFHP